MALRYRFPGTGGLDQKFRTLAGKCKAAVEGMPRTMLIAVTAPDPGSTPDCEIASPRGLWINTIDSQIHERDMARVLGAMMGMLEKFEHELAMEFGEEIYELVDDARNFGHAMRWSFVPVSSTQVRPWRRGPASKP
jgi:hypothetical protein